MRKINITAAAAIALIMLLFAACVDEKPIIHTDITPEPSARPVVKTPDPTEAPDLVTPAPTDAPVNDTDAMGDKITGPEHFSKYLTFENLIVYEEAGDTFMDGTVKNSYPVPITCAVDIVYYNDDGEEIARARLQTRDGNYLLKLMPGETVVFARILTDMTLTDREFKLEFDTSVGIIPAKTE